MQKNFQEYAEIQQQIKVLDERKKELSNLCLEEMQKVGVKSMKGDLGTFSITERVSYKYSEEAKSFEEKVKSQVVELQNTIKPQVEELETSVKELKEKEVTDGKAEKQVKEGLMFRIKKQ